MKSLSRLWRNLLPLAVFQGELHYSVCNEAMSAVVGRQSAFILGIPLQVGLKRRVVIRVLVKRLAPRVVRGNHETLGEALLQLEDQGVIGGIAPATVDVVLQDQRIMKTHDRPSLVVRPGAISVDVERADEMDTPVEVVPCRERIAVRLSLDLETGLLGVGGSRCQGPPGTGRAEGAQGQDQCHES